MNIILKKSKNNFSYIRYFLFTYLKIYSVYEKYFNENIFYIPYKKTLKLRYFERLKEFLRKKEVIKILALEEDIKEYFKKYFSVIYGKYIYSTIFYNVLEFLANGRLFDYEIIFVSDNLKEIKIMIEKCVKNVKSVSVLTNSEHLYDSLAEFTLYKYGTELNIRTKKEKLKKKNKIYVNCGHNLVFEKNFFKNVNMLDIYGVYEGAYKNIILEAKETEKEFIKLLECEFLMSIAEFLYGKECDKKFKIKAVKK